MSRTFRTVRFPAPGGGVREQQQHEVDSRWRTDRNARLQRAVRDEKRIVRADLHTERLDDDVQWRIGSTVRAVA